MGCPRNSLHTVVGEWKNLENQPALSFALLDKRWPAAWANEVSPVRRLSGKFGFSSESLQPEIFPVSHGLP